ncbi:hypothetical protein SteCoe_5003 [Stentor coeruleus]|uniref:Trichohyalin-plectin-homology domain-containing protein n=1 Tax=Stentor coeruleus TaxID=5963 RepID=A0A1R2CTB4_9CILI|nr:hypothetical protein SteCoe_5003 [Stentor coeruleus]
MSFSITPRVQTSCMCHTMRSRISDIKTRTEQRRYIYDSITNKYGKNSNIQSLLLHLFRENENKDLSLSYVEKFLQKKLSKPLKPASSSKELPKIHKPRNSIQHTQEKLSENEEGQWASIIKLDTQQFLQDEINRIKREKDNKAKLKRELDKQVTEKQKKLREEALGTETYDEHQKKFITTMTEKDKKHEAEKKNRLKFEKKMLDDYYKEVQNRKRLEMEKDREYEEKFIKKIKDDLKSEEINKKNKKDEVKKVSMNIIKEYEEQKKQHFANKEKEKQQEIVIMQEYTKMLDHQEQDRINFAKLRESSIHSDKNPKSLQVILEKNNRNLNDDFELYRMMAETERKARIQDDMERKNKVLQQKELRKFYDGQVSDKIKKKINEENTEREVANAMKKENDEFSKYQDIRFKKERIIKQNHAEYLKFQMKSRPYQLLDTV